MSIISDIFTKKVSTIHDLCKRFGIDEYYVNSDGSIDVIGNVIFGEFMIGKLPIKIRNITGHFTCMCKLDSLEGSPRRVTGRFTCVYNGLSSLEGGPEFVNGEYICRGNNIKTFKGVPESFNNHFNCYGNPIHEIYKINTCIEFLHLVNEYDVIREGDKIVETRLRQALVDSDCKSIPKEFQFKHYDLI